MSLTIHVVYVENLEKSYLLVVSNIYNCQGCLDSFFVLDKIH